MTIQHAARCLLREFAVECVGFVAEIGGVRATVPSDAEAAKLRRARDANDVYTPDAAVVEAMTAAIHAAKVNKDTDGGLVCVV